MYNLLRANTTEVPQHAFLTGKEPPVESLEVVQLNVMKDGDNIGTLKLIMLEGGHSIMSCVGTGSERVDY